MKSLRMEMAAALIATAGWGAAAAACAPAGQVANLSAKPVQTTIRNVNYRFDRRLLLYVDYIHGALLPARQGAYISFDNPRSFQIAISSARVAMSAASLARLMNAYVFGRPGAGFTHIRVEFKQGKLIERGTIHQGIALPAELTGTMRPTRLGKIRFHPTRIRALHLPMGGLMHLVGLNIGDFINQKKTRGLRLQNGDLILDPAVALPAPHVLGRVLKIRIGRRLWLRLGSARAGSGLASPPLAVPSPLARRGYMIYRGGELHLGHTILRPADLEIINAAARGPLDFFLREYQRQLVAARVQATPRYGWIVYMPGYGSLQPPRP